MWRSKYITVLFVVVGALVLFAGCSSGGSSEGGGSGGGSSGGGNGGSSESSQTSSQAGAEKTTPPPETTQASEPKPSGGGGMQAAKKAPSKKTSSKKAAGTSMRPSALEGLAEADVVAGNWNKDAELYSIASVSPEVDAQGRSPGWLYSYVSEAGKGVALISVEKGKARLVQEPPVPESQLQNIYEDTLPSSERLIDSSEAMDQAAKIKTAIQKNPDSRVSAGLDAVSSNGPTWTLASISQSGPVQEQVPATF